MAQEWKDFIASSPERAVRYTHTPQFFRRQYFDTVVKPKFTGAPADLEAVWEDFNLRADTADQKILEPEMYQRAQVNRRQKPVGDAPPYSDFLATHLESEGGFTAEEYRNNAVVRGIVRGAYFEHVIQPRVPLTKDIGPIREDYNRRANDADLELGFIEKVGFDKQTQAKKSGLPSLTPVNLSEAPKDGGLLDSISKDAARTLPLEEGELSPRDRKRGVRERYMARLQAEGKPKEVIDRLLFNPANRQPARTMDEITRDNLLDRMVASGTPAIDAAQILDSPAGQKLLAETRTAAIQYGAEMATQGDATWTRLWQDFKSNANRNIMETAKNRVWAAAALDVDAAQAISRIDLAKRLSAAADDYTAQLPEPLVGRGFWGQGVVDGGGMAPMMLEGILATMVGGPVAGTSVFASDQIGRHYRYAVEEAGLAPGLATRLAAISGGVLHASLEQASLSLARTPFGKSGLLAKAIDKATLKYTAAVARRPLVQGAVNFTANTAEQILQEGAQQAVEVLHNEFANYRGGRGFDISQLKSQVMDAMKQAAAPSILVGAVLGAPSGARVAGLSNAQREIDAAEAELKAASAEQRSAAQQKLDQWNTRASELRQSLGWESPQADAPQTTTGGPLDAPTDEAPATEQAPGQKPPPANAFTIDGQDVVPGLELEGPDGKVTVLEVTPDPETTEMLTVVRNAAGEEVALTAAEMADGGYRPVAKPAQAPKTEKAPAEQEPAPSDQRGSYNTEPARSTKTSPVTGDPIPEDSPTPEVTDRFSRLATKGLPLVNGEPVRLRETLYRDGKPYRVFRMLDDERGKVYAVEFEGLEKPVTVKELARFSRRVPAPVEPVPLEKQVAFDLTAKPAPQTAVSPVTGETIRTDEPAPPVTAREERRKAKEPPVAEAPAETAPEPAPVAAPAVKPERKPRAKKPKASAAPAQLEAPAPEAAPEPPVAQPEPAPPAPAAETPKVEAPAAPGIVMEKRGNLSTDVERFQLRETDFAEETVAGIVADFESGKLTRKNYASNIPPVLAWKDPKDGKTYILGGHSRLEAYRRMGINDIPTQYFQGTEEQAIQRAEDDNNLGTQQTLAANARGAKRMRDRLKTIKEYEDWARGLFGKNWQTIDYLTYLTPGGALMDAVRTLENTTSEQSKSQIRAQAAWIGAARKAYPALTDAHEKEMHKFLMANYGRLKEAKSQVNFLEAVGRIAGSSTFDPGAALNLERTPASGVSTELQETIRQKNEELSKERKKLKDLIERSKGQQKSMFEAAKKDGKEQASLVDRAVEDFKVVADRAIAKQKAIVDNMVAEIDALNAQKANAKAADQAQGSMFDVFGAAIPPKPKAPAEAAKPEPVKDYSVPSPEESRRKTIQLIEVDRKRVQGDIDRRQKALATWTPLLGTREDAKEMVDKLQRELKKSTEAMGRLTAKLDAIAPDTAPAKSALSTGTYETAKPELVALGRQVVADGYDTLPKFTRRIKELLGDAYSKLKGKIGDLWKAVQEDRGSFRMGDVLRPRVRSKARQAARRWLVTGGAMPDWMFELDLARKGWMAAQGKMIEMRTNAALKALKKHYGTLTAENMEPVNSVLAGEVDAMTLPEAVRGPVTAMRDAITHLQDQLLKSGMLDEKMTAIVEGSKGVYLTRTHRVFDDPKFYEQTLRAIQELQGDPARLKVVKEALRFVQAAYYIPEDLSAVSWPELLQLGSKRGIAVKGRPKADILADLEALVESKGREVSLAEAQNMLADFLSVASPVKGEVKTATAFAQGDIVGTKDLRSFMRRKDIPVELRDLLGENKDPILNFSLTGMRIAQMVANHKFLTNVAEIGKQRGVFFTKDQDRVGIPDPLSPDRITTANEQFPDSPALAPLSGLYVNAEIKRAMMEAVTPVELSTAHRIYLTVNAMVKLGKTGYSPIATTRNFSGNSIIAMMGGHYRLSLFNDARAVAWSAFVADGTREAEVKRLVGLGIIGSSSSAGEMQAVMEEAHLRGGGAQALHDVLFERQIAAIKAGHGKVMGFYQLMDDIWKVYAFYNEHATYTPVAKKKGWTAEQLDRHVAGIVRDITPTYAMQPAWVKAFRRWPFQGTFISFPYAMWRVLFMSGKLAIKEMQDADTYGIGLRRAASLVSGIAAPVLAVEANNLRLGITDEDDEWGRKFMAPYMRNGLIWWIDKPHMGKDGRVRLRYINLSFTLPTAVFLDPIMSLVRGARIDEFGKGMMAALQETLSPYTAEELLAGALMDIRDNEARSGKPIINRQEMNDWQQVRRSAGKVAAYFGKEVAPGFISQGDELWKGYQKFVNLYGKKYDMVESAASIASGVRIMQSDLKSSLGFAMSRQHADNTEATAIVTAEASTANRNPSEASLRAAVQSAEKSHQYIWVRTRELVAAARAFGLPDRDIREAMVNAGMGKDRVRDIMAGRYYVWTPGNQFMSSLADKIEASEGAVRGRAEILRRRMIIERIARENANTDFGILPGNVKPIWRRGE